MPENLSIRLAGSPELVVHIRCQRAYTKMIRQSKSAMVRVPKMRHARFLKH